MISPLTSKQNKLAFQGLSQFQNMLQSRAGSFSTQRFSKMDQRLQSLMTQTNSDLKTISSSLSKVIPKIDFDSVIEHGQAFQVTIEKNNFYYTRV